ncbi:hypothetical protein AVEN_21294-1 [Araneus ventricosus]|uniref:Uncharacterized protein n=1 Tax=Araneus ventricosus TaxID=182803 RepID=A0A4Y2RB36_ARAVE|nr:hypothetical protein AVEN_21294-1 [Araneus ventricosus]
MTFWRKDVVGISIFCCIFCTLVCYFITVEAWAFTQPKERKGFLSSVIYVPGMDHEVHLQWIPSHVDIYGNEVADDLAKQGTGEPLCSAPSLTFDEIYSIRKNKNLKTWRVPPSMIGISGAVLVAPFALPVIEPTRRRCLDLLAVT